jgi:hypothetical protein
MADSNMLNEYPEPSQRFEVCTLQFSKVNLKGRKVSFDYDGVLTNEKGRELAKTRLEKGDTIYIISARKISNAKDVYQTANELGITNVYITGSNSLKISQINRIRIDIHYDDNPDVIDKINNETKALGKLWH